MDTLYKKLIDKFKSVSITETRISETQSTQILSRFNQDFLER